METIQDLIQTVIDETNTNGSDINSSLLLSKLQSERDIIVEEIKSYRWEDYFAKAVYHDLIPGQYKYWDLYAQDELGTNSDPINKYSAVYIKYKEDSKYKKAEMTSIFHSSQDVEDLAKFQSQDFPRCAFVWKYLYIFPTLQPWESLVTDGVKLWGLITLPEITMATKLSDIWGGRIIPWASEELLKKSIEPLIFRLANNMVLYSDAKNDYEILKRKFLSKIGRIKEPMVRELPEEEIEFYSN